jgi:pimeloyl-ACP methyl ester carboxylesterase
MAIRVSGFLALVVLFGGVGVVSAQPGRHDDHGHGDHIEVTRRSWPVVFTPDHSAQTIVGYVYNNDDDHRGRSGDHNATIVLIHGATYDHRYWDPGVIDGEDYSYARHLASLGYQVIAIDQLGAGESTHPNGDLMTIAALADGAHQAITQIRSDRRLMGPCDQIGLIGHSMGSMTSSYLEGTYHDVDALVVTGYSNVPHTLPVNPADFAPFMTGPYFSLPGPVRAGMFYYAPYADPAVIDFDNTYLVNTLARGQLIDAFSHLSDATAFRSNLVTVPVLVQIGEFDALYLAADTAPFEAATWPASDDVTVEVVANSGHDLNLHVQHRVAWNQIDTWLDDSLSNRRDRCGCRHGRGH